ncbi:MAG: antibiotic biosynthesis monooxygenase [Bacteroidia bacterium]|nr:antibiotic biosynthesis monooxygenase [Bacteroidia bacterium]MCX7652041.1 antibiotic biosynthesis monooxygenase [Bacteroidia bacterium]MDW8416288.1 antibiotic biosynthesis monooxygenase family protein [Bacteroidia bacterium]
MLWRWVEMPIHPDKIEEARAMLLAQAPRTRAFPGCLHLTLYEAEGPNLYSLSQWQSVEALEAYRHSAMFRDFWVKMRVYFRERARATSMWEVGRY